MCEQILASSEKESALRRWYAASVYLVVSVLIGSAVGQYEALAPLGERRGLPTTFVLSASFTRFDVAHALIGLVIGIASLTLLRWVRQGR